MLASPAFVNAGRLSRMLRFVVERTLDGQGDQLKEYLLGVEVFDRPSEYDPRLDSIVRVEARRLRAKLAEYYEADGAGDACESAWPKAATPRPSNASPRQLRHQAASRPARRTIPLALVVAAAVLLAAAALVAAESGRLGPRRLVRQRS